MGSMFSVSVQRVSDFCVELKLSAKRTRLEHLKMSRNPWHVLCLRVWTCFVCFCVFFPSVYFRHFFFFFFIAKSRNRSYAINRLIQSNPIQSNPYITCRQQRKWNGNICWRHYWMTRISPGPLASTPKGSTSFFGRTRKGHRQSDQYWKCLKGNIGETPERRGWSAYGFSRAHIYHLELNRTELNSWRQGREEDSLSCRREYGPWWLANELTTNETPSAFGFYLFCLF